MDKNRIRGFGNQAKGALKAAAGKATGDTRLRARGEAERVKGKVQSTIGRAKDAIRQTRRKAGA